MSSTRRKSASDVDQAGPPASKRLRGKSTPLADQDTQEETCEIERLAVKHGLDNSQIAIVKVLGLLMDDKFAKMQESLESQVARLLSQSGMTQNQSDNAPSSPPTSTSPSAADEPMRGSPDESSSSAQPVISADRRPDAALGPVSGSSDALEDAEPEPLGVCSDRAGEIEKELKTLRANLKAAVDSEDFETAVALQERETELQQQLDALEASKSEGNSKKEAKDEARLAEVARLQQELAAVSAEKLAAAEDEDFERADELKDKETEIRQQLKALEANSEGAAGEGIVEVKPVSAPNEAAPPPPLISSFREATKAELAQWPQILAKFAVFMETAGGDQMSASTRKSYVKALKAIVEYDMKAPDETASVEYQASVKCTFEDIHTSGIPSASLKWFRDFWEARGDEQFEPPAGDPPKAWILTPKLRLLGSSGDGSAESRAAVDIEGVVGGLPEGWHIHARDGCQTRWSSPNGRFYKSTRQISRKLAPPPPPGLTTPSKNRRKSLGEDGTPEPPAEPPQPLEELLGPVGEKEKATQEDKDLTPRVLSTFARFLQENLGQKVKEGTRECYVRQLFTLIGKTNRNLATIADPAFCAMVHKSEESKKSHGILSVAAKHFSTFWQEAGGYKGTYDQPTRDHLNLAFGVRPNLVDAFGGQQCGFAIAGGEICRKLKQRCDTCNTVLRCSKHAKGEHTVEDCRDIFWATHSLSGTRNKTVKDFFRCGPCAPSGSATCG